MNKYLVLMGCIVTCPNVSSMQFKQKKESSLNLQKKDFVNLVNHSKKFLKTNLGSLAIQENESGFVRINIPAPKAYGEVIDKLRINYWPNKKKKCLDPETIHNHPRYFESMLIHGGYRHSVFTESTDKKDTYYNKYTIFKQPNFKKKFVFLGKQRLKNHGKEAKKQGDIVRFPVDVIHRVEESDPLTMSLNAVEITNDAQCYNVYSSLYGKDNNVKTVRYFLNDHDALAVAKDALQKLNNYTS